MACLWIGINHTSHGIVKVDPKRRLLLEFISGIIVIISWCVIIPGLVLVATSDKILRDLDDNFLQYYGVLMFMIGNGLYLLGTLSSLIRNLSFRKDILLRKTTVGRSEWKERERQEVCCDICNPLNGGRMFHHLKHRSAALSNLIVVVCSAIELSSSTESMYTSSEDTNLLCTLLGFSSCILLITLIQTFLSYFYAEDVALCGIPVFCCVYYLFIRRYPQEVCDAALAEANEENPAKVGKYSQFQNEEEETSPPPYSQVIQQV